MYEQLRRFNIVVEGDCIAVMEPLVALVTGRPVHQQ
jgi:hypothetical protein